MGILNLTPDSFSGDGVLNPGKAIARARQMVEEGADILDIGAESTRPGARPVSVKEEIARLLPSFKKIRKALKVPISIDTQNSETARVLLEEGADIINDISCLRKDSELARVVARFKAGFILMHSRGTSRTMSKMNRYRDLSGEVIQGLKAGIIKARSLGIQKEAIVIDPGIGFAKVGPQNIKLLRSVERIGKIGYPICLGISRKSFIGGVIGNAPQERDFATAALHSLLIERGVNILRVHSVEAARQAVLITQAFLKKN